MTYPISQRQQRPGRSFGGLPTLAEEGPSCASIHLRDAKPRRPRNHRRSITWDPTLDIYDDTFAFKQPTQQQPRIGTWESQDLALNVTQLGDRRSTLLAHPAQRAPLPTQHGSTANIKKRRTSSSRCVPPEEPIYTSHTVQLERIPEGPTPTIRRDPRRRTIYIPADDTTVVTIHPGAHNSQGQQDPRRPRRSDAFFDLATQSTSAHSPSHDGQPLDGPGRQISMGPRKSLAVAPRRVPLQESTRPMQAASINQDTPGTGAGKENIPPGFGTKSGKPEHDDTLDISLSLQKGARLALKHIAQSPNRRSSFALRAAKGTALREQQPSLKAAQASITSGGSEARKPAMSSNANIRRSRTSMLPSIRRSSSITEAGLDLPGHGYRTSTPAEGRPGRESLSSNLCLSQLKAASFPVLTEDIARPQLYEDRWLSHQETALTECINSLLASTRPQDAETVDSQAMLRRQLSELCRDASIDLMHRRLQASLRFGALAVSRESLAQVGRYKHDMHHKRRFLDLWLNSYDMEALQAAAEVVLGRGMTPASRLSRSPTNCVLPGSPARRRSLETFLKLFLIGNEDAARTRTTARPTVPAAGSSTNEDDYGSQAWAWRRTVVRSLMIIWLLDRLQQSHHPQRTVCLFQVSSTLKSSVAVVQALGSLLLPSAGNVIRTLEHLSYHVSHVQYPLEEHQYHIDNLAVDMRDGVSLTRLVEMLVYPPASAEVQEPNLTITLPGGDNLTSKFRPEDGKQCWPLSQHLKYPCLSRVQKVYNVQIALSALREVESLKPLLGNLKAEDIANGHREKTVSLLWAMVSRWGFEALVDFRFVERDIARLRKAWAQRPNPKSAPYLSEMLIEDDGDVELPSLSGLGKHTQLLKTWAQCAARLHNVRVSNLSTSFADGKAYAAIVREYAPCVKPASTASGSCPSSPVRHPSGSTAAFGSTTDSRGTNRPVIETLQSLGCSRTFTALFANSSGQPTITGSQTTIPLLAFLASRLLPVSRPHFAALSIQRAWRRMQMRSHLRKQTRLALLARECSLVVQRQHRIVDAAITIQRAWRKREEALTMPRGRGKRPCRGPGIVCS